MFAPSYQYLRLDRKGKEPRSDFGTLHDDHVAYIGPDTGFLPSEPLEKLPPPFDEWEVAASKLSSVCRTDDWDNYIETLPTLTAEPLPQEHLLQANLCVGMIAHSLAIVGERSIPESLISVWEHISSRLKRPSPCLLSLDSVFYNFDTIPKSPTHDKAIPTTRIQDPWSQTKRRVSITGTITENNFVTSLFAIGLAVRQLPGAVARAQQATIDKNNRVLRTSLLQTLDCIEAMVLAFQSGDARPLSSHFVDHVEFMRATNSLSSSVVPRERTAAGSLFPSISLLDAFFSRKSFDTEMGKLILDDRPYLPKLFRDFYDAVRRVSVFDYIQTIADVKERSALQALFLRTFNSFASESGFLGKHRIRINAFMEIGVKVGRLATASGVPSVIWQKRVWEHVNGALLAAIDERMNHFPHGYSTVYVDRSDTQFGGRVQCIRLRSDNEALAYKPGDHVSILPVNSDHLVSATLQALDLSPEFQVKFSDEKWKSCFRDHDALDQCTVNEDGATDTWAVSAEALLKFAALQPLADDFLGRLKEMMFLTDSALLVYLSSSHFTNVPTVFDLIKDVSPVSVSHLSSHLDKLFQPMKPRLYSIASNMENTPGCVDLYVGAVHYDIPASITFADGSPPWRKKKHKIPDLDLGKAENILSQFIRNTFSSRESEESNTAEEMLNALGQENICVKLVRDFADHLRSHSTVVVNAKLISRANVILSNSKGGSRLSKTVGGISSSYLWGLGIGDKVRIKIEPNLDFRIPQDPSVPIIMVALGTGAAPFRSFIHELIREKNVTGSEKNHREAWLILGARTENDVPFKEDIEDAFCNHKVIDLTIALSREEKEIDPALSKSHLMFKLGKKRHVHDLFEDDVLALKLWNLISKKAHVYTCGRPEIEQVVRRIISSSVQKFVTNDKYTPFMQSGQTLKEFAEEFPDRMAANRCIHIDTYFSGVSTADDVIYTVSEVATHNSVSSCWVVFRGYVYDISQYLQIHPGGPKTLMDKGGRDMTSDFNLAHGEDDYRVASMIGPYKIGRLDPLRKCSIRLKHFMEKWSVPFLYSALEHQSVFMLDCNEFPDLHEPVEFLQWKSPVFSDQGRKKMAKKVLQIYEADAFTLICQYFTEAIKARELQTVAVYVGISLDFDVISSRLESFRKSSGFPISDFDSSKLSLSEAHRIIKRGVLYHEEMVKMCIAIQRSVERAMKTFELGGPFEGLTKVMLSEIFNTALQGVEGMMESIKPQSEN